MDPPGLGRAVEPRPTGKGPPPRSRRAHRGPGRLSLYADSSALLKRYVDEPDSDLAESILQAEPSLLTGRHAVVEIRRNLTRLLEGSELEAARAAFLRDVAVFSIVELDKATCDAAASIAEVTGVRTLDALHLAAVQRAGGAAVPLLTFDQRQAQAARSLGLTVLGV